MWDRIQAVRNQELGTLWRSAIVQALFGFTLNTIPVLVSVLTFGVYVLLGNKLTAAEAFTSLSLFTVRTPAHFHLFLLQEHWFHVTTASYSCVALQQLPHCSFIAVHHVLNDPNTHNELIRLHTQGLHACDK